MAAVVRCLVGRATELRSLAMTSLHQLQSALRRVRSYHIMEVFKKQGHFFGSLYKKEHIMLGSILGPPMHGKPHMFMMMAFLESLYRIRVPKGCSQGVDRVQGSSESGPVSAIMAGEAGWIGFSFCLHEEVASEP